MGYTYRPLHGATTPLYVRITTIMNTDDAATTTPTLKRKVNSALLIFELIYFNAATTIISTKTPIHDIVISIAVRHYLLLKLANAYWLLPKAAICSLVRIG